MYPERDNNNNNNYNNIKQAKLASILLLTLSIIFISFIVPTQADDRKSASDLIRSRGFNLDEFDVISQNYILKIYRIINPLADPKKLHKIPVVCAHGISWDITNMMASSINSRPRRPKINERLTLYAMENGTDDRGLHFYLSNNNYDVWLIESRATNDRVMRRLSDGGNDKTFWDFSLDEQALIDLPLQLEFVLKKTNSKKVAYIAYSQSTTLMFMLLSMRPEFSEKIACFIAMAPVVYTSHLRGLVWPASVSRMYTQTTSAVAAVPNWLRRLENFWLTYMCSISYIKYTLCRAIWYQFSGPDKHARLDGGMTENVLKSTSFKSFEQYMHNSALKDFRMYDYKDEMRNMEEYGQIVPPQYNVSKINLSTISLFRGTSDYLSDPEDQMILLSKLRVPIYEDHILEDYSHIDFIASPTVTRDINEPILRILDKCTNRTVKKISHTLGNPNPQVKGTQLELDTKEEDRELSGLIRKHVTGSDFKSEPEAEKPKDGVFNKETASTLRDQLTGKAPTRSKSEQKS